MEVRNSIPVPHTEGEEHLSIDVEFQRVMKELYQKVDTKNIIVGWCALVSICVRPYGPCFHVVPPKSINVLLPPRARHTSRRVIAQNKVKHALRATSWQAALVASVHATIS